MTTRQLGARIGEVVRYGVVGGSLVVIEYTIYLAIVRSWPAAAVPAFLLSRFIASVAGFVAHSQFTFRGAEASTRNGVRYALLVAANTVLASLLLIATLPVLGPLLAKVVSDCIVITASYLVGRHLVFAPSRQETAR